MSLCYRIIRYDGRAEQLHVDCSPGAGGARCVAERTRRGATDRIGKRANVDSFPADLRDGRVAGREHRVRGGVRVDTTGDQADRVVLYCRHRGDVQRGVVYVVEVGDGGAQWCRRVGPAVAETDAAVERACAGDSNRR